MYCINICVCVFTNWKKRQSPAVKNPRRACMTHHCLGLGEGGLLTSCGPWICTFWKWNN